MSIGRGMSTAWTIINQFPLFSKPSTTFEKITLKRLMSVEEKNVLSKHNHAFVKF